MEIIQIVKDKYQELSTSIEVKTKNGDKYGELKFRNNKYQLWFMNESSSWYIVGINNLHKHFASGDAETNLAEALYYLDQVIKNEIVAVGYKSEVAEPLIELLPREEGITKYLSQADIYDIVSFSKEYS